MKKLVALVGMILSVGANSAENSQARSDVQKNRVNAEDAKKVVTSDELVEEIDLGSLEREINPVISIISRKYQPKSDAAN